MLRTSKSLAMGGVCLVIVACVTCAVVLITRASSDVSQTAQTAATTRSVNTGRRNLALQPEAFRVARQLGKRFGAASRSVTAFSGQLTLAGTQQAISLTRRQAESGETVELSLANRALTWNAEEGMKANAGALAENERLLLERLILDSPDNFVLAQLRGAGYFTVARNVRPADAADNYDGPLWTIVRVDEAQDDKTLQPNNNWRLYYINSNTGLVDRIVSRPANETIEARIMSWTEQAGEKVPAQITWSIDGRAVMSYQATAFSHTN